MQSKLKALASELPFLGSGLFLVLNAVTAEVILLQHEIRRVFSLSVLVFWFFFLCSFALFGHCIVVHFGPFSLSLGIMMCSSPKRSKKKSNCMSRLAFKFFHNISCSFIKEPLINHDYTYGWI
jgi:hypothetical protein